LLSIVVLRCKAQVLIHATMVSLRSSPATLSAKCYKVWFALRTVETPCCKDAQLRLQRVISTGVFREHVLLTIRWLAMIEAWRRPGSIPSFPSKTLQWLRGDPSKPRLCGSTPSSQSLYFSSATQDGMPKMLTPRSLQSQIASRPRSGYTS
jgi:hypothetical protein